MKLYGLLVYNNKYELVASHYNLDDFFFLYRSTISDTIERIATNLVKVIAKNNYYKINEEFDEYDMTLYCSFFDTNYIVITDRLYPQTTAYSLLNSLKNSSFNTNIIANLFKTYQRPLEVDKLLKVKKELDETKVILYDSIEKLLERGDKLDELVDRSEILAIEAAKLAIQAEKLNRCCTLL